jgi:CheY-like chemotaxis protein
MPFMDGYEATRKIRKLYSSMNITHENQPKIIAITGHIENEYVDRALASGMD